MKTRWDYVDQGEIRLSIEDNAGAIAQLYFSEEEFAEQHKQAHAVLNLVKEGKPHALTP